MSTPPKTITPDAEAARIGLVLTMISVIHARDFDKFLEAHKDSKTQLEEASEQGSMEDSAMSERDSIVVQKAKQYIETVKDLQETMKKNANGYWSGHKDEFSKWAEKKVNDSRETLAPQFFYLVRPTHLNYSEIHRATKGAWETSMRLLDEVLQELLEDQDEALKRNDVALAVKTLASFRSNFENRDLPLERCGQGLLTSMNLCQSIMKYKYKTVGEGWTIFCHNSITLPPSSGQSGPTTLRRVLNPAGTA